MLLVYVSIGLLAFLAKFLNYTDCGYAANYWHVVQFCQWPSALTMESLAYSALMMDSLACGVCHQGVRHRMLDCPAAVLGAHGM